MTEIVRHWFSVSVDVPAKSGDGWNRYPDYSAEEVHRQMRRALHERTAGPFTVHYVMTVPVPE